MKHALLCLLALTAAAQEDATSRYDLTCEATLRPERGEIDVSLVLGEGAEQVHWLRLSPRDGRHLDLATSDGSLERQADDRWLWEPPDEGGRLRYRFVVDKPRDDKGYAALATPTWMLFKLDDLMPSMTSKNKKGARSTTRIRLFLPAGWELALPFALEPDGSFVFDNPNTWVDRPRGWVMAGHLDTVEGDFEGMRCIVAGPAGVEVRAARRLALIEAVAEESRALFGPLPERLLIVSAEDPLWLGGLSGRRSIYIHARRHEVDDDGTWSLIHEWFHAATRNRTSEDGDWISEGLAELYAVELPLRSGLIDAAGAADAFARIEAKGEGVEDLLVRSSTGKVSARAVVALRALDAELRARSEGALSMDDVVREIIAFDASLSSTEFKQIVDRLLGEDSAPMFVEHVPGWPPREP